MILGTCAAAATTSFPPCSPHAPCSRRTGLTPISASGRPSSSTASPR